LDKQPQGGTDLDAQYRKVLAAEGVTAAEIDRQLRVIIEQWSLSALQHDGCPAQLGKPEGCYGE